MSKINKASTTTIVSEELLSLKYKSNFINNNNNEDDQHTVSDTIDSAKDQLLGAIEIPGKIRSNIVILDSTGNCKLETVKEKEESFNRSMDISSTTSCIVDSLAKSSSSNSECKNLKFYSSPLSSSSDELAKRLEEPSNNSNKPQQSNSNNSNSNNPNDNHNDTSNIKPTTNVEYSAVSKADSSQVCEKNIQATEEKKEDSCQRSVTQEALNVNTKPLGPKDSSNSIKTPIEELIEVKSTSTRECPQVISTYSQDQSDCELQTTESPLPLPKAADSSLKQKQSQEFGVGNNNNTTDKARNQKKLPIKFEETSQVCPNTSEMPQSRASNSNHRRDHSSPNTRSSNFVTNNNAASESFSGKFQNNASYNAQYGPTSNRCINKNTNSNSNKDNEDNQVERNTTGGGSGGAANGRKQKQQHYNQTNHTKQSASNQEQKPTMEDEIYHADVDRRVVEKNVVEQTQRTKLPSSEKLFTPLSSSNNGAVSGADQSQPSTDKAHDKQSNHQHQDLPQSQVPKQSEDNNQDQQQSVEQQVPSSSSPTLSLSQAKSQQTNAATAASNNNRSILLLRDINSQTPEKAVMDLFESEHCSSRPVSCEYAHNDSWYVTFKDDDGARLALAFLFKNGIRFNNKQVMARIKSKPASIPVNNAPQSVISQQTAPIDASSTLKSLIPVSSDIASPFVNEPVSTANVMTTATATTTTSSHQAAALNVVDPNQQQALMTSVDTSSEANAQQDHSNQHYNQQAAPMVGAHSHNHMVAQHHQTHQHHHHALGSNSHNQNQYGYTSMPAYYDSNSPMIAAWNEGTNRVVDLSDFFKSNGLFPDNSTVHSEPGNNMMNNYHVVPQGGDKNFYQPHIADYNNSNYGYPAAPGQYMPYDSNVAVNNQVSYKPRRGMSNHNHPINAMISANSTGPPSASPHLPQHRNNAWNGNHHHANFYNNHHHHHHQNNPRSNSRQMQHQGPVSKDSNPHNHHQQQQQQQHHHHHYNKSKVVNNAPVAAGNESQKSGRNHQRIPRTHVVQLMTGSSKNRQQQHQQQQPEPLHPNSYNQ